MKKSILGLLALILVFTAAAAANDEVIKPQLQTKSVLVLVPEQTEVCIDLNQTFGLAEIQKEVASMANSLRKPVTIRPMVDSCAQLALERSRANAARIAAVDSRVRKNSAAIAANTAAIKKLQKCCKKKVAARHYKKRAKTVAARHYKKRAKTVADRHHNWCQEHRLAQVMRPGQWYRHGCGVRPNSGNGADLGDTTSDAPGGNTGGNTGGGDTGEDTGGNDAPGGNTGGND